MSATSPTASVGGVWLPLVCRGDFGDLAPPAFRGYVDMSSDVELGAHQLCEVDMDSESEVEDPVHFGFEPGKPNVWKRPVFHGYRGFLSLSGWSLFDNGSSEYPHKC